MLELASAVWMELVVDLGLLEEALVEGAWYLVLVDLLE